MSASPFSVVRRIALAAGMALAGSAALAALPPEYQRLEELKAILVAVQAEGVAGTIGEINVIEYVGTDHYEIRSVTCTVAALIVTTPQKEPGIPGPRIFEVRLQPPVCR